MQKPQKHGCVMALLAVVAFAGLAHAQCQLGPSIYTTYRIGDPAPDPIKYPITGTKFISTEQTVALQPQSSGWLSASLSSLVVPSTLTISINPAGMPAGTWPSSGNLPPKGSVSYSDIVYVDYSTQQSIFAREGWCVYLTVLGPTTPIITSILNAASFVNSPLSLALRGVQVPASPGEVISIFGSFFGPPAPVGLQLDSTGKVSTELGGVQVLIGGNAAPLTYVSATQINCVVPYAVAPGITPGGLASIQIKYLGQPLTLLQAGQDLPSLQTTSASPGIFTATGTGTGQAATLNSDNSPNSASNPASAGSTVQVFMTGEGQIKPAGVTGSVTCSSGCAATSQIPKPVLPVAAFVNGLNATVAFYSEAPGLVSGVMQVNVTIPPNTRSGADSLVITVGSNSSQAGVTIAVK